jgi:propanol-preferring alcohol dehydrogenase
VAIDYSGSPQARVNALDCARIWGRVAFVGEGNETTIRPSPQMLHKQLTVIGSWVFGLWELRELAGFLLRHRLHPEAMVTHRYPLERISEALRVFESGRTGKVVLSWD